MWIAFNPPSFSANVVLTSSQRGLMSHLSQGMFFSDNRKKICITAKLLPSCIVLAALPLIYGPVSLLGSFSLCATEVSSAVPREQLVLFHPWQPRYWTSPVPVFFLLPVPADIAFCLPSRMDQWLSWFRFYSFVIFLSFRNTSLTVFAEGRTISKSKMAPFISGDVFLGWFSAHFVLLSSNSYSHL